MWHRPLVWLATVGLCTSLWSCSALVGIEGPPEFLCRDDDECAETHVCSSAGRCTPAVSLLDGSEASPAGSRDEAPEVLEEVGPTPGGSAPPDLPPASGDAGTSYAGTSDAGTSDAGTSDAGTSDAGTSDAGTNDAGSSDAGSSDAGTSDAGTSDEGTSDAGSGDAGTSDAGTSDDSGPLCLDDDTDGYGSGCALGIDCAPNDDTRWRTLTGYVDGDGDGFTVGGGVEVCAGAGLPAGFAAAASSLDDCDDNDDVRWRTLTGYVDGDGDGFTVGDGVEVCAGASLPAGFAAAASALDDCDDNDDSVQSGPDTDQDGTPDCLDDDDDGDGLLDDVELDGSLTGFVTDPLLEDSDGDGADDRDDPAPTIAECKSALLFFDDFSTDPTVGWTVSRGDWVWDAPAGVLANTSTTSGAAVWIGSRPDWADYTVEVTLTPGEGAGDAGLLFRAANISVNNDGGQQYYVGLYPGSDKVVLGRMNNGWSSLANAAVVVETGQSYRLKVHAQGESFEVSVDDELVLQLNDTNYVTGSVGLRTYNRPTSYHRVVVCR